MHTILAFIESWLGGLSEVLLSFFGVLVCVLAVGAFWDRRIRTIDLAVLIICGSSVVFSSFIHKFIQSFVDIEKGILLVLLATVTVIALMIVTLLRHSKGEFDSELEKSSIFTEVTYGRSVRGSTIGVPVVMLLSIVAVVVTGLLTPQAMIGDEVTHYYMLVNQAEDLSKPQFFADIPVGDTEEVVTRRYPHPFGWHYLGALIYRLTGGSFAMIQLYQTLFLLQLLTVAYSMARNRDGVESRAAFVYVLLIASLPLTLIFSVTFYQDVPMTAQVLTAFYLLQQGRWFWASMFLALAISFKVTAILFYPSFFILLLYWQTRKTGWFRALLATIVACVIVIGATWGVGRAIVKYGDTYFYPQAKLEKVIEKSKSVLESSFPLLTKKVGIGKINTELSARPGKTKRKESKPPIIANHPGDLRIKANFLVYGGLVMWFVVLTGIGGVIFCRVSGSYPTIKQHPSFWLLFVGGSYTVIAAWYLKTAPDARFFLPGLPFLLLPFAERSVCLPKPKVLISIVAVLAFLQGSYVLQKTYNLRSLTPDIKEAIHFLEENPLSGIIFMYPEGNYRYFPVEHEWYLNYRLRELWRGNNDERIEMLQKFNVSAIVIKKYLIAPVDQKITNLGVYPTYFVEEISTDQRFVRIFDNDSVVIYEVPKT